MLLSSRLASWFVLAPWFAGRLAPWFATGSLILGLAGQAGQVAAAPRQLTVTVYNQNLALVKDVRSLDVGGSGRHTVRVHDVSAQIDPTSVHLTPRGGGELRVIEQNFQYDLVSADRVLERYVDRELAVDTKDGKSFTGVLLAFDPSNLVLRGAAGLTVVNRAEVREIQFPELPGGLITRPTLVWTVNNGGNESREAQISYLTGGLSWHAEYVAVVDPDDRAISWTGWVSLENQSGTSFPDARLKLVAGDVNRVRRQFDLEQQKGRLAAYDGAAPPQPFTEQAFFEYHLYTLDRPASLENRETKQIALFDPREVPTAKTYTYDRTRHPTRVAVALEFTNVPEAGLGLPLPAGTVRVYKEDRSGTQEFVGEDQIAHTAKDEKIRLRVGNAFDVVGEYRPVTTRRVSDRVQETSHEIRIRNHKDEKVTVQVVEHMYGDWEVVERSQKFVKKDASTIEFPVEVAPNGEAVVTYTVRTR